MCAFELKSAARGRNSHGRRFVGRKMYGVRETGDDAVE